MKYDYPHPIKIWKRQRKLKAIEGEKEEKMSVGKRMKNAVAFKNKLFLTYTHVCTAKFHKSLVIRSLS